MPSRHGAAVKRPHRSRHEPSPVAIGWSPSTLPADGERSAARPGIDLYIVAIPHSETAWQWATASLSRDELDRAYRFVGWADRQRNAVTRAALRSILAEQAQVGPADLAFSVGQAGKPGLAGRPDICFNVSHSGDVAVIGVSGGDDVGVDVELPARVHRPQAIAARYFHPSEAACLAELDTARALRGFLRCWTAKEAVAKALGRGVAGYLSTVRVDAHPERPLALLATPDANRAGWSLHELALPAGRAAVLVAVRAPDVPLVACSRFEIPT